MLELSSKTGGGVSLKGRHSCRGHQMCKGMEVWLNEPHLWNFRKPLGLVPEWGEAATRDKGLASHELSNHLATGARVLA